MIPSVFDRRILWVGAILVAPSLASAQAPTDVDGLQLWLDASDAATITTSGGLVTQWDDKSGNGNHATQADPNRQPTVEATAIGGAIPAIRFDTTGAADLNSDGMTINPAFSLGRPYTVLIVDQYWGAVQERTLQGRDQNWLVGKWRGANAHFSGAFAGPNNVMAGTNVAAIGEAHGGGVSEFRVNGQLHGRSGFLGAPGNLQIGVVDDPAGNPPFDEPSQSDVSEILIYDRVLTDVERDIVAGYFRDKFGIGERKAAGVNATRTVPFTGGDPGEGLDFEGTFHAAVNARGPGGATIGDATFTDDTGVITSENDILNWGPSPTEFSGTANDTALNSIMESIRWTASNGVGEEDLTATVSGLTVGNTYKLQMLFGETTITRHFSVNINGDPVIREFNEAAMTGASESRGVAVVHEFVAQTATLDVVLDGTAAAGVVASGDINPLLQALTVEDRGATGISTSGTFASAADLDFTGTFIHAVNINGPGGLQIGDAVFTDDSGVALGAENAVADGSWGNPDYGATSDDDNLETVMRTIRWTLTNGRGDDVNLQLGGLVAGRNYKLQLLFDEHSGPDRGFDVIIDGVLVLDDFGTGDAFGNEGGVFVSHLFVADDADVDIVLDGFATPFTDRNPILGALTLEETNDDGDADNDGLLDDWELRFFGDTDESGEGNPDGDGLTNIEEQLHRTDPTMADPDNDMLDDDVEVALGTDPFDNDSDGDNVLDGDEVNTWGSDPLDTDSDLDRLNDGDEVAGSSHPAILDTDGDGFNDRVESEEGSAPDDAASTPGPGTYVANFTGGDVGDGLDLEGDFLYAVNVGTNAAPGPVRDADFTADSVPGVTITAQHGPQQAAWNGAVNLGDSANDDALEVALASIRWSNGRDAVPPEDVVVSLTGLDVGGNYKLQLLFGEACCPNRGFDVFVDGAQIADDFRPGVEQNDPRTATGAIVIHEFDATGTTLDIRLDAVDIADLGIGDFNPILSAFTLERLPPDGPFAITSITRAPDAIVLEFNGASGRNYSVDYKASLDARFWEEVDDSAVGTGPGSEWMDLFPARLANPRGFYRVRDPVLMPDPN